MIVTWTCWCVPRPEDPDAVLRQRASAVVTANLHVLCCLFCLCRANVSIYSYLLRQSTVILDMMFWSLRIKYNLHASATPRFLAEENCSFLIWSQKILGSTGCFKQAVPINSMKIRILRSFLYYVRYMNGFLIESSEPSNMLVCFYVANWLLVHLRAGSKRGRCFCGVQQKLLSSLTGAPVHAAGFTP